MRRATDRKSDLVFFMLTEMTLQAGRPGPSLLHEHQKQTSGPGPKRPRSVIPLHVTFQTEFVRLSEATKINPLSTEIDFRSVQGCRRHQHMSPMSIKTALPWR